VGVAQRPDARNFSVSREGVVYLWASRDVEVRWGGENINRHGSVKWRTK